ncbi:MAG: glycosyltransferase family 4 protein [Acidobacteriota bacterium]|nr:glycosyltransferase family 4 protein [Acidobacteriota bacterium]
MTSETRPKIKLVFIVSIAFRWFHLEWILQELDRSRFDVSFILVRLNGQEMYMERFVREQGIPHLTLDCYIGFKGIVQTIWAIRRYCRREQVDVVHTHIFLASLVGLMGAFLARVPRRLNTRHHLISNHGKPTLWLDHLASALATRTIVASQVVHDVLTEKEGVPQRKLVHIPFGIDLDRFRGISDERIEVLRRKYDVEGKGPVVGVLARRTRTKGLQYIIPAFRRLLERHPDAYLLLAYANGPYQEEIEELLAEELPEDRYLEIKFETDVFAFYQLLDLCVHAPTGLERESFGLVYLEAMASGVPTVFTPCGVGPEIFEHRENTWVVEHENSDQIYEGMVAILESPELHETLVEGGRRTVDERFPLKKMVRSLEAVYLGEKPGESCDAQA